VVTVGTVSTQKCQCGYGQLGFQQTYPFLQSVDISPRVRFYVLDVVYWGKVVFVLTLSSHLPLVLALRRYTEPYGTHNSDMSDDAHHTDSSVYDTHHMQLTPPPKSATKHSM
jgi:hypothetical protein